MKIFLIFFVFGFSSALSQSVVNRVFVKEHRKYMHDVIQEVIYKVEDMGWCNLKLPDMIFEVDHTIFGKNYMGKLTYKNGFLVSIQNVDILTSSLNQLWTVVNGAVRGEIRGQLRMTNAALGYDIEADFSNGMHHYTGMVTHPLLTFDFSFFYWPVSKEMIVTVTGAQPNSNIIIDILPQDPVSDALTTMFDIKSTEEGVLRWASDVLEPFANDVIRNVVEFPGLCYNCVL